MIRAFAWLWNFCFSPYKKERNTSCRQNNCLTIKGMELPCYPYVAIIQWHMVQRNLTNLVYKMAHEDDNWKAFGTKTKSCIMRSRDLVLCFVAFGTNFSLFDMKINHSNSKVVLWKLNVNWSWLSKKLHFDLSSFIESTKVKNLANMKIVLMMWQFFKQPAKVSTY